MKHIKYLPLIIMYLSTFCLAAYYLLPYKLPVGIRGRLNSNEAVLQLMYDNDYDLAEIKNGSLVIPTIVPDKSLPKGIVYLSGKIDDYKHADNWDRNITIMAKGHVSGIKKSYNGKKYYIYNVEEWRPVGYITKLSMYPDQTFSMFIIAMFIIINLITLIVFMAHIIRSKCN